MCSPGPIWYRFQDSLESSAPLGAEFGGSAVDSEASAMGALLYGVCAFCGTRSRILVIWARFVVLVLRIAPRPEFWGNLERAAWFGGFWELHDG